MMCDWNQLKKYIIQKASGTMSHWLFAFLPCFSLENRDKCNC